MLCHICDKSFTHFLDQRRRKHGMTYKEANMIAREKRWHTSEPKHKRRTCPFQDCNEQVVRIKKHLLSQKHNLKFGTTQFQKMRDRYYGKVTSPIKPSFITNKNSVTYYQVPFRNFLEDPLDFSQPESTSEIT